MKLNIAIDALAALAQETRLRVFKLLVEAGPEGKAAGAIAESLGVQSATLSFHLAQLGHAGLVSSQQKGRFVIYSANFPVMDDLIAYLTDNCCEGGQCLPRTAQAAGAGKQRTVGSR
jgi:DNA-binding transcriptional ArsR family regulator